MSLAIELLEKICDVMERRNIAEVELSENEIAISVRREAAKSQAIATAVQPMAMVEPQQAVERKVAVEETSELIKAPMPGMFYRAASPDDPPFAKVGDRISKNEALCLIEAMKVFNEIEAEFECEIVEILVENATPLEFDQPIFRVKRL